jgi:hypothetical protein
MSDLDVVDDHATGIELPWVGSADSGKTLADFPQRKMSRLALNRRSRHG